MFELEMTEMIDGEFTWELINNHKGGHIDLQIGIDEIHCQYSINKLSKSGKKVLKIFLGRNAMNHLDVMIGNKVLMLQDKKDVHNYLLVKSDKGKKVMPNGGKTSVNLGILQMSLNREGLGEFKKQTVAYFKNSNGTIRIILPKIKVPTLDDELLKIAQG